MTQKLEATASLGGHVTSLMLRRPVSERYVHLQKRIAGVNRSKHADALILRVAQVALNGDGEYHLRVL